MSEGDGSTFGLIQPLLEATCQMTIRRIGTTAMRACREIFRHAETRSGCGENSGSRSASAKGAIKLIPAKVTERT